MAAMNCNVAVALIHDYLDGDLPREQLAAMQQHLAGCAECNARFEKLSRTDALIRSVPDAGPSPELRNRILKSLPKQRTPAAWTKWVRRHPAASAAAMFVLVMLTSFVAMWNADQQLSVAGPDLANVDIEGHTVIVPEGVRVQGDLTVVNGSAQVLGDLDGNLTVIDGSVTLASTAHIAGKVKEIDRAVDWIWYKVESWFGTIAYGS